MTFEAAPPVPSALLALQRATHTTLHVLAVRLADLGLTAAEINALGNLADDRARTASQLAAAVGSRPSTLTSMLDRLERRGLVERVPRPGDRRAILVRLTEAGREAAGTVQRALAEVERQALDDLDPTALDGFHTVLRALSVRP